MKSPIIPLAPDLAATGGASALRPAPSIVTFHRTELGKILSVYGRMVAAGEWRDYAIDHLREAAVFSVFRRASEAPLYRIEKRPKLAQRQGAYAILSAEGQVLKRGRDLAAVLKFFDRKLMRLIEDD